MILIIEKYYTVSCNWILFKKWSHVNIFKGKPKQNLIFSPESARSSNGLVKLWKIPCFVILIFFIRMHKIPSEKIIKNLVHTYIHTYDYGVVVHLFYMHIVLYLYEDHLNVYVYRYVYIIQHICNNHRDKWNVLLKHALLKKTEKHNVAFALYTTNNINS